MSKPLTLQSIARFPWSFGDRGGAVLSESLRLEIDGTIAGYSHPSQRSWRLAAGNIEILDHRGLVSCVLSPDPDAAPGETVFQGIFLLTPNGPVHVLRQFRPRVSCFFRTHFWDQSVQKAYSLLQDNWDGPVIVASDQTVPFEVPAGIPHLPHSLEDFRRFGLRQYPAPNRTMWYNGDYPIYTLLHQADCDYFVICEYDLAVKTALRPIIEQIILEGVDYSAPKLHRSSGNWSWYTRQKQWDEFENLQLKQKHDENTAIFASFFPIVLLSRSAAIYLFKRRLDHAYLTRLDGESPWPFCESFVPTELYRGGFNIKSFTDYTAKGRTHLTFLDVRSWKEAEVADLDFLHPVTAGNSFVGRVFRYGSVRRDVPNFNQLAWLAEQRQRCSTDQELVEFDRRMIEIEQAEVAKISRGIA